MPPLRAQHLVEQLLDPLGEHRDLCLLQRDAGDRRALAGLQEEGARPWLAHRAGDEPLRGVVVEDLTGHDGDPTRPCFRRRPRPTPLSTAPSAVPSARRRRRRPCRGHEAGQVAAGVVDAQGERPQRRVPDDRHRARVDDDPLEGVEVHAERVGEHRLDDVAVRDGDPDGVVAVRRRRRRRRAVADGLDRAQLHGEHRLALLAREGHGGGVRLDDPPQRLLGELLQRAAGPVAVAGLAQAVVDRARAGRARGPGTASSASGSRGSAAAGS